MWLTSPLDEPSTGSVTGSFSGTAPRKAEAAAGIGPTRAKPSSSRRFRRVKPGPHLGEFFYLDKDELDENDTGTRLLGATTSPSRRENTTIGATYMKLFAHEDIKPGRDGLNVFNVRAYTAPLTNRPGLSFDSSTPPSATATRSTPTPRRSWGPISSRTSPGNRSSLSICVLPRRRSNDLGQRSIRPSAPWLLRLGHLMAGRDRRRVFPLQLQPHLASVSRPCPTLRRDQRRRDLLQLRPRSTASGCAHRDR